MDELWDGPSVASPKATSISYPRCRPGFSYDVQIWKRPLKESEDRLTRLSELAAALGANPLSRNARRKHLGYLMLLGRYHEGAAFAKEWLAIDRIDPNALRFLGNLLGIIGNPEAGIRTLSGILDVQPENDKIAAYLANYLEGRGRYAEAYPFRATRSSIKPESALLKAERALAAARANRLDEAAWIIIELAEARSDGTIHLKPGVKLPADVRAKVFYLAGEGRLPAEEPIRAQRAKSAKFSLTLKWQGRGDLDLLTTRGRHQIVGGEDDRYHLSPSARGNEGETLIGSQAVPGSYSVYVICASNEGCASVSGELKIRVHGHSQTLPFDLEHSAGRELARIKVERHRRRCGYNYPGYGYR